MHNGKYRRHMANQHTQKQQLLTAKKKLRIFPEKCLENGELAEKCQNRKSTRTRQKNKRGDRKEESRKIPDRGVGDIRLSPCSLQHFHWYVTLHNLLKIKTIQACLQFSLKCRKSKTLLHASFSELYTIKTVHLSYSNSTGSQFLNR